MPGFRVTVFSSLMVLAGCTEVPAEQTIEQEAKRSTGTAPTGPTCAATTDYQSDPNNCGTCGTVCGSGVCYSGVCPDATAGHVLVIGHGYATSNPALDKVLGNAVFMHERNPVRVLAYSGTAPTAVVAGTNAAIGRQATARGRAWTRTQITNSSDVAAKLPNNDVFVVYAQPQHNDTYLGFLGDEWSLRLDQFARRGGIIVVLDTVSANAGTAQVLTHSGLMTLGGRGAATNVAYVGVPEDVVAARMPLMFGLADSVGWTPSTWTNVATSETGQAVVVHRAIY